MMQRDDDRTEWAGTASLPADGERRNERRVRQADPEPLDVRLVHHRPWRRAASVDRQTLGLLGHAEDGQPRDWLVEAPRAADRRGQARRRPARCGDEGDVERRIGLERLAVVKVGRARRFAVPIERDEDVERAGLDVADREARSIVEDETMPAAEGVSVVALASTRTGCASACAPMARRTSVCPMPSA